MQLQSKKNLLQLIKMTIIINWWNLYSGFFQLLLVLNNAFRFDPFTCPVSTPISFQNFFRLTWQSILLENELDILTSLLFIYFSLTADINYGLLYFTLQSVEINHKLCSMGNIGCFLSLGSNWCWLNQKSEVCKAMTLWVNLAANLLNL